MLRKFQALIIILSMDAALTLGLGAFCDNYVTPKETALGLSTVLLIAVALAVSMLKGTLPRIRIGAAGLPFTLWLTVSVISAFASKNPSYSLGELRLPFLFILIYITFRSTENIDKAPAHVAVAAPIFFAFLFSLHGIAQYFGYDFLPEWSRYSGTGVRALGVISLFGNPDLLADFLAIVFPLSIAVILLGHITIIKKLLTLIAAAMILSAIVMTGSRGGLFAAICGAMTVSAIKYAPQNRKTKVISYTAVAAATLILILATTVLVPGKKESFPTRILYWKAAISMFLDRPALGTGPGGFRISYFDYQREYFKKPHSKEIERVAMIEKPGHPHNEYFNALAETGIAGGFLFALTIFGGIFIGVRRATRGSRLTAAWVGALVSFAVISFFGFPMRIPTIGFLLPVCLAFLDDASDLPDGIGTGLSMPIPFRGSLIRWSLTGLVVCIALFVAEKQIRPLEARMFLTAAKRMVAMRQLDAALVQAEKSLKMFPDNGETNFTIGAIYLATGRAKESIPYLIKAKRTSSDPNIDFDLGIAYSEVNDMKRAIEYMKSAEETNPGSLKPKKLLISFYLKAGDTKNAETELYKAHRTYPEDKEINDALSALEYMKKKRKQE